MSDDIVIRDNGVEVLEAPKEARVTLELIARADAREFIVKYDRLLFAGVTYQVIGWDECIAALIVRKVET